MIFHQRSLFLTHAQFCETHIPFSVIRIVVIELKQIPPSTPFSLPSQAYYHYLFIHIFQPSVNHYPTIFHKDSEGIHLVHKVSVKPLSKGLRQRHDAPLFMLKMK